MGADMLNGLLKDAGKLSEANILPVVEAALAKHDAALAVQVCRPHRRSRPRGASRVHRDDFGQIAEVIASPIPEGE